MEITETLHKDLLKAHIALNAAAAQFAFLAGLERCTDYRRKMHLEWRAKMLLAMEDYIGKDIQQGSCLIYLYQRNRLGCHIIVTSNLSGL